MPTSPFKFLDSYTREDRHIFFGRDREIEELYHRVFESKIMLVYGVSGTGKSSLINCGLANKFQDTDWLPINVRRAGDILQSMAFAIQQAAITPLASENLNPKFFKKAVKSLYLDHYKPVFFIFDQIEELFIFGNRQEQKEFFQLVKALQESELSCRFIFVLRKEYLADVSEFERLIPTLMANRVNIERMTLSNATQAIEGPCKVSNIQLEEGFSEALLEKLSPGSTEVELTYLQVFLDKLYHMATKDNPAGAASFSKSLLEKTGNVSDLLGSFLDDQISLLEDPDTALAVLKSFVSVKGTKRQMSPEEIQEYAQTLGKPIEGTALQELIQTFIHLRILRDKDQNNRYELRHDALAEKIYEKITLVEKELLEIRQLIENAFHNWQKRGVMISSDDLDYIAPFESRLYLSKEFETLVEKSKFSLIRAKRRRRNIAVAAVLVLLLVFGGFTIWALKERKVAELQKEKAVAANQNAVKAEESALLERNRALENEKKANASREEAEIAKGEAINAKQLAKEELIRNYFSSLTITPLKMNVLYRGVENPVSIHIGGIPDELLSIEVDNGKFSFKDGLYYISPQEAPIAKILVYSAIGSNKKALMGTHEFRVKNVPDPYATFAGKTGGIILKEVAFATKEVEAKLDMDFDLNFTVNSFWLSFLEDGFSTSESSDNNLLTQGQFALIGRIKHNGRLYIESVNLLGPGGDIRKVDNMVFRIFDYQSVIESKNDSLMHKAAVDFYNASNNDKEKYLLHSLEIFNAMNERKPDDIFDELKVLQNYYRVKPSIEIENKIKGNFGKLMAYDWQSSDIDTVFGSNIMAIYDILTFIDSIHFSLGFPEFFIQLTDKLLKSQSINEKGLLTQLSSNISMKYAENVKTYDYSIKLLSDILKVDSSDVNAKIQLLGIYENQQKDSPSEDLRSKIDILEKELLLVNDIEGLREVEGYLYNKFYRNEIPWSSANIQKYLFVCEKIVNQDTEFSRVRQNTAYSLCYMTYYLLFKKEFKFALQSIQLAIKADEKNITIYEYLPLVYLLNNQYEDAEKVYNTWKDKPWTANDRFKTFGGFFLRYIEEMEIQGITHPDFKKIKEIISGAKEMPSEQGDPNIFVDGNLGSGLETSVITSGSKTGWANISGKILCMNYPAGQSWGSTIISIREPKQQPNLKRDYSQYKKISLELKGQKGGETVLIGIKDRLDPDNGTNTRVQLTLANDWKTYEINLSEKFLTDYLPKIHVVTEFAFGTEPQSICVRKIQFLK
jgi:hypothetical protein